MQKSLNAMLLGFAVPSFLGLVNPSPIEESNPTPLGASSVVTNAQLQPQTPAGGILKKSIS